jgi:hypothetical protein
MGIFGLGSTKKDKKSKAQAKKATAAKMKAKKKAGGCEFC